MPASIPDLTFGINLAIVNGFEKPVVLMTGTTAKRLDQVDNILVVYALVLKLVNELALG